LAAIDSDMALGVGSTQEAAINSVIVQREAAAESAVEQRATIFPD
jgi:hypothetical protein